MTKRRPRKNDMSEEGVESVKGGTDCEKETGEATPKVDSQMASQSEGAGGSQSKSWAEKVESEQIPSDLEVKALDSTNSGQPSYASVLNGSKGVGKGWSLAYVEPKEGRVSISQSEFDMGTASWENTLVGMVIGRKPGFMEMKRYVQNQWRLEQLKMSMLGNGVCLYTFKTEEQKNAALQKGWTFYGFPLILKQWKPEMDLENISFKRLPVWIRLPKLHLSLWNPVSIGKIASFIGIPMGTDELTAKRDRMDFARVLVEVELMEKLPEVIPVDMEDGSTIYQDVEFEWDPVKCSRCSRVGHTSAVCKAPQRTVWVAKNVPEVAAPVEDTPAVEKVVKKVANEGNKKKQQNVKQVVTPQSKSVNPKGDKAKQINKPGDEGMKKAAEDRGKGLSSQYAQQGKSTITLKSPGIVVVQMEENQKSAQQVEFDNQGMQIAGGGKPKRKPKGK